MAEREAPFDVDAVEESHESITIVSRFNQRIFVPHLREYRDIGVASAPIAALVIDDTDPAFAFMKEWAMSAPDVEIRNVKPAVLACPMCGEKLTGRDALAIHAKEVHWDDGNENPDAVDPERPRGRAPRRKASEG